MKMWQQLISFVFIFFFLVSSWNILFPNFKQQNGDDKSQIIINKLAQEVSRLEIQEKFLEKEFNTASQILQYSEFCRERIRLLGTVASLLAKQSNTTIISTCSPNKLFSIKHKIAMIVPVTSKDMKPTERSVLFTTFITSLIHSGSPNYHYRLYLGYNEGDPLYSNTSLLHEMLAETFTNQSFTCDSFVIDLYMVVVPKGITGSNGLSILFALPTLHT